MNVRVCVHVCVHTYIHHEYTYTHSTHINIHTHTHPHLLTHLNTLSLSHTLAHTHTKKTDTQTHTHLRARDSVYEFIIVCIHVFTVHIYVNVWIQRAYFAQKHTPCSLLSDPSPSAPQYLLLPVHQFCPYHPLTLTPCRRRHQIHYH